MNFLYKCIQIYPIEHIHTLTRISEYLNEYVLTSTSIRTCTRWKIKR